MSCHRELFESRVSQSSNNSLWQLFPESNYLPNEVFLEQLSLPQVLAEMGAGGGGAPQLHLWL